MRHFAPIAETGAKMITTIRKFAGIFLVLIAVLILMAWEVRGREMVLMDEILVAKFEIAAGETLNESMFTSVSVPRDAIAASALGAKERGTVNGKITTALIPQNGQVAGKSLRGKEEVSKSDDSFFVVRREWIFMRSSALRRGDFVDIVSADNTVHFGRYKIAFVKNAEEEEVTESVEGGLDLARRARDQRVNSSSKIDHVEVIATQEQYLAIQNYAETGSGPSLILIQREAQS
jgi:hypothetical protein